MDLGSEDDDDDADEEEEEEEDDGDEKDELQDEDMDEDGTLETNTDEVDRFRLPDPEESEKEGGVFLSTAETSNQKLEMTFFTATLIIISTFRNAVSGPEDHPSENKGQRGCSL